MSFHLNSFRKLEARVLLSISRYSMLAISAKFSRCSELRARLRAV